MNTFVYYYLCLLIVSCQTTGFESEENDDNNDSPDTLPKVTVLHYKTGSTISMDCNNHYANKENIVWEFKHCIDCEDNKMDYNDGQWKKLDVNRKRKKLKIRNATEENMGLYRCLYNDSILKIYVINLVVSATYVGPAPEIISLTSTTPPESSPVIHCTAKSVVPPEILWFKESTSLRCKNQTNFSYTGHNYCAIPTSNYSNTYPISDNIYASKLDIYNFISSSGTYVCLVISLYGVNHRNITVEMEDEDVNHIHSNSFSLLFLIPVLFLLVPLTIWFGFYYKRKRKCKHKNVNFQENEHQKQLITKVVEI